MLKRIFIHNYKTFVNFEWRPPSVCVLVGENGTGKTALLEILRAVREIVVDGKRIDETTIPGSRTAWLQEVRQVIELELVHDNEAFLYRLECIHDSGPGGKRTPVILEQLTGATSDTAYLYRSGDGKVELFENLSSNPLPIPIPFDRRRSFIATLESDSGTQRIVSFRSAVESIWSIKPDPPRITSSAQGESDWLEPDLSNFAAWYRAKIQEDPTAAAALTADLREVLVGFVQLKLETVTKQTRELRVQLDFGKSHELSFSDMSEGQRLLVALYGVLRFAVRHVSLLLLDEVENYVALPEIQPWLRAVVDEILSRDQQLLVISHHPRSIDYLAVDAVWVMSRDRANGQTRISLLQLDPSAGETASTALILGAADNA